MQFTAVPYNNHQPTFSIVNWGNGHLISACAGDTIAFFVSAFDQDNTQNTSISASLNTAGLLLTHTGTLRDTLHAFLVVDSTMISPLPYQLNLTVADDACPYFATANCVILIYINGCGSNVWPGDANADLNCNMYDILPIGLAFDSSGTIRTGASLLWTPQPSLDWTQSLVGGINYKYADCNGDGVVDWSDTTAIGMNYGLTHPLRLIRPNLIQDVSGIHLVLSDTVGTQGYAVSLAIELGELANPAIDVAGIAFRLNFDPGLFDATQSHFNFVSGQLGIPNSNLLTFVHPEWSSGFLDVAAVRIDHQQGNIDSIIANLRFVIAANAPDQQYTFTVSDIVAVDVTGQTKTYGTNPATLDVQSATGINDLSNRLVSVFPNPARTTITFKSTEKIQMIHLLDAEGRIVLSTTGNKTDFQLNISSLSQGYYSAEIYSGNNIIRKKIFVQR